MRKFAAQAMFRCLVHTLPVWLTGVAILLTPAFSRAARPAEEFARFTDDGGWCWFSDPRAVSRDGKTYTGWVTEDGSIVAGELDHATATVRHFTLHAQYERDDHDNPAFLFLPDGRLMAFYTKHGGNPNPAIHARVMRRPGAFLDWEPEVALSLRDDTGGRAGISYVNPFLLSAEDNTLYLFWRGLSWKPTMAKSRDGGKTWSPAQVVFSAPGLPPGNRPYAKYASNGRDRIHFLFTDGHPRNEPHNSVYYLCYRGGAFYKANGTRVGGMEDLPVRPEQADKVYDARATGVRAWIWGVAFDAEERPVVVYTRLPAENDHRYHYARWDGRQWFDTELCAGGGWFPQTPPGAREREPHYSSGLALDPSAPSVVYLTRPVNGVREVERWTTPDGGKTWRTEAVTRGSKHDNVRPCVVLDHAPGGPTVLWQSLTDRYVHYTDYRCAIVMDAPARVTFDVPPPPPPLSGALAPTAILTAMERVGDWQLANPSRHPPTDWTQGAGYAGIMALADLSGSPRFREAMVKMGQGNQWKPGPRKYFADDHTVGQTYLELFFQLRDEAMIAPLRAQFDAILAQPRHFETLDFTQRGITDLWSWCDALFMGPPTWLRLYAATDDARYREFALTNWWRTSDYLYDREERLYFRDSKFFNQREANGRKIFWSRGNGWVMGGLVRSLQYLPTNDPERARLQTQFKEMAAAVLQCQQPDGLWRASLLDPASFPMRETSGSGFFTYALAWGVNQGLLDRATYEPAIRRAWPALVECVTPQGRLTHVQPIGADPRQFNENATEIYGVGAFLLAGSEVYRLAVLEQNDHVSIEVRNLSGQRRDGVCAAVRLPAPFAQPVVMDALSARILPTRRENGELLFPVNLAAGETRTFIALEAAALAAVPPAAGPALPRAVPPFEVVCSMKARSPR